MVRFVEGYLYVHNLFDRENIAFALPKLSPMLNIDGKFTQRKTP